MADAAGLDFEFSTHINGKEISLPSEMMLVPGSRLADRGKDNTCFLGVFRNTLNDEWVFGTNVMQRYYTVFDATQKPARLGFGIRSNAIDYDEDADNDPVPDPVDPGDDGDDPAPLPSNPDKDDHMLFLSVAALFVICALMCICYACFRKK